MTPAGRRAVKVALFVLVVAGGAVFLSRGADRPADPTLLPAAGRTPVEGFGEIGFRIERAGPERPPEREAGPERPPEREAGAAEPAAERCALLARTDEQRARGLMQRRDLSGYDGMLFDFAGPTTGAFWMKDTPLPLSIAWFDASGRFVSATDMEPCLNQSQCRSYSATGPYRYALEVPKGGLRGLGVGPGARLVTTPACR
ncbi:MAG: DUF192 domain-containing protein [Actinomycetota bacterium]|nr:DUF192 domain-containing protein [Actinomycetota bacterium]